MKTNYELVRDIIGEINKENVGKEQYQIVENTPTDTLYILLGESYIAEIQGEYMEEINNPFEYFIGYLCGWNKGINKNNEIVKDLVKGREVFEDYYIRAIKGEV